ncbi:MAG: hypothetical protein Q9181_006466 [Wetmoreana brouardii]
MTRSPLGFIFKNYVYRYSILLNDIIEQTLVEAAQKIERQLANNPTLENQALDDEWFYIQDEHEYMLGFTPNEPEMTYGGILTIIPLISTWATQYACVETDFEIYSLPRERDPGTYRGDGWEQEEKLKPVKHSKLPKMPGDDPIGSTFPYHMTPDHPLGLIFNHYDYLSTFDNKDIEQLLAGATRQYDREIQQNPALVNETLDGWGYEHNPLGQSEDYYELFLNGEDPAMTWGRIPAVIAELEAWAREWRTVETDFEVCASPGTGERRRLGSGCILFII